MKKRGIKPELETYHPGGAWVIRDLIEQGLVEKPYWIQTVMGYQTSSYPTVEHVLDLLRDFPDDTVWLCSGIGPYQLADDDARAAPRRPRPRRPRRQRVLPAG